MKTPKILFAIALSLFACRQASETKGNEHVDNHFPIFFPVVKDTSYHTDYIADVHSLQHVEIRSRIGGYIEGIYVDEGQDVKKGQLLFSLTSQGYKEELMKAKAQHKSAVAEAKKAEMNYYNAKLLADKEVIANTEVEMAKAELEAMNAQVERARSQMVSAQLALSYTQIKAPFNGVINRIPNKKGSLIDEGTLLTTLSDNREMFAYFNMSEREFLEFWTYHNGPLKDIDVELILANNRKHTTKGYVETMEGEVAKETGTIAFRARFKNPENTLKHGASGKIRMTKRLKDALIIPQKSTFEIQDQTYVFVLDSVDKVHMQSVIPKYRLPHLYVIDKGLSPHDRVIYEGTQMVKEGLLVIPDTVSLYHIENEL